MFGKKEKAKFTYAISMIGIISGTPAYASQCVRCSACLEKCSQQIEIPDALEMVAKEPKDLNFKKKIGRGEKDPQL